MTLTIQNENDLQRVLEDYQGENLKVEKEVGGAVCLVDESDEYIVAEIMSGELQDATESARNYLGRAIDRFQDAGFLNEDLKELESFLRRTGGDE